MLKNEQVFIQKAIKLYILTFLPNTLTNLTYEELNCTLNSKRSNSSGENCVSPGSRLPTPVKALELLSTGPLFNIY